MHRRKSFYWNSKKKERKKKPFLQFRPPYKIAKSFCNPTPISNLWEGSKQPPLLSFNAQVSYGKLQKSNYRHSRNLSLRFSPPSVEKTIGHLNPIYFSYRLLVWLSTFSLFSILKTEKLCREIHDFFLPSEMRMIYPSNRKILADSKWSKIFVSTVTHPFNKEAGMTQVTKYFFLRTHHRCSILIQR